MQRPALTIGRYRQLLALLTLGALSSCSSVPVDGRALDVLIVNGLVYDGYLRPPRQMSIGISNDRIVYLDDSAAGRQSASRVIDAGGLIVTPGFIDPHTHSLDDLLHCDTRYNRNYQTQGVSTVIVGNDGGGSSAIDALSTKLVDQGIGSNVAFLVGHGRIRSDVFGEENRAPTESESIAMASSLRAAMRRGALGLSSGLYYSPGSFAKTAEVIELARIVSEFGGIYDTHIRDESSYSVGLQSAIAEAIEIGRRSNVAVNISHIKALGVDVWGQSEAVIDVVNVARASGLRVTADQYPWRASGTSIRGALIPNDQVEAAGPDYPQSLEALRNSEDFVRQVRENLRRRGGPGSVFITRANDDAFNGLTLQEVAKQRRVSPLEMVFEIELSGGARIASFNMQDDDIERFMVQEWVMTSSDGSTGHPRKYATFPMKFQTAVVARNLLSVEEFVHRSTLLVANTFNLHARGRIEIGAYADIAIIDPTEFLPQADYSHPERLSSGVRFLLVNGQLAIDKATPTNALPGRVLSRGDCAILDTCSQTVPTN